MPMLDPMLLKEILGRLWSGILAPSPEGLWGGLGPPDIFWSSGAVFASMTLEYLRIVFLQILGDGTPPPLNT